MVDYHLLLPKITIGFGMNDLTFSINKIRSRKPSVLYFRFHCFNMSEELIYTYNSSRWVIGTVYEHREEEFSLTDEVIEATTYAQIELVLLGVDSENPLYFTEVMLQNGDFKEYHQPSEVATSLPIKFNNNTYANLYKDDGDYLQVIRPNKEPLHTNMLDKSKITILAPHFDDDKDFDDDVAVFIEAMNQREQTIDVLR